MDKFASFILKYKKIILMVVILIFILSIIGLVYFIWDNRINSDMLEYLPENTSTSEGIKFLKQHFGIKGDAFIVVEGDYDDRDLIQSVERLKKLDAVSQFVWYQDIQEIDKLSRLLDSPLFANVDISIDAESLATYLKTPLENGKYNYVLLMLFDHSPSTFEAFNILDTINKEFSDRNIAISGMTALSKQVMEDTLKELVYYIIFAVLAVSIVLLLTTSSYFEPIIMMLTLGVAIVINMGTNIIFPSISIVSFASAGVLQLGVTMDYAIFYMHAYKKKRLSFEPQEAAKRALPKTSTAIIASSLTTMGGFLTLCFMQFTIGIDLAKVIVKGIALSLVTVLVLQPILVVYCDKLLQKTKHKELKLNVEKFADKIIKWRKVIIVFAILLIVPAFIVQRSVPFSYLKIYEQPKVQSAQQERATQLANQVIMAVPLQTKTKGHKEFMDDLMEDEKINNVIGAYSILQMPQENMENVLNLLIRENGNSNDTLSTLFKKIDDKWYTLYLVEISGDTEDEKAFKTHNHLMSTADKYFENYYPLGMLTGTHDMAKVTPIDFIKVTLISAGVILLVLGILLKSFRKAAVMVILIELAIWINISLNYIFNTSINFMVYLIISSVQLGCTVDYAILLSTRFEEAKTKYNDTTIAIKKAVNSSFPAITTSAAIIASACISIVVVSKNLLVREMARMLARGAIISYTLVIVVLPCLLIFFKKIKPKDGPTTRNIIERNKVN